MTTTAVLRHPAWCDHGHRCGLGEHRAEPVTLTVPRLGTVVLTRVRATSGAEHAEIRLRIALAAGEPAARAHLGHILTTLDTLIRRAIHPPR